MSYPVAIKHDDRMANIRLREQLLKQEAARSET